MWGVNWWILSCPLSFFPLRLTTVYLWILLFCIFFSFSNIIFIPVWNLESQAACWNYAVFVEKWSVPKHGWDCNPTVKILWCRLFSAQNLCEKALAPYAVLSHCFKCPVLTCLIILCVLLYIDAAISHGPLDLQKEAQEKAHSEPVHGQPAHWSCSFFSTAALTP